MLDQVLEVFGIVPDVDFSIMKPNQNLSELTSNAIIAVDGYIKNYRPDLILVQGDTTTVFAAALVAFYHKISIGHIEAGLRTWNKFSPFPEEINRVFTTKIADIHFAPTDLSKDNLLKEGASADKIFVTGNTVIDALLLAKEKVIREKPIVPGIDQSLIYNDERRMVLITGHRRENFGDGFENICNAIAELAQIYQEVIFIYPVHLNPNVREPVFRLLGERSNVYLLEPLSYLPFVSLMQRSTLILTDSGGVQEEAPSLGKPVLVMRENTERPEAVTAGTAMLTGTSKNKILNSVIQLLDDRFRYSKMANAVNPYGDGTAAKKIVNIISQN